MMSAKLHVGLTAEAIEDGYHWSVESSPLDGGATCTRAR
jgi:hypothetical protein